MTISLLLFPLTPTAQIPGSISARSALWRKGDDGSSTTTGYARVGTCTDQRSGLILTGVNALVYVSSGADYNPAVFYKQGSYYTMTAPIPILNSTLFLAGELLAGSCSDGYCDACTINGAAISRWKSLERCNPGKRLGHYNGCT